MCATMDHLLGVVENSLAFTSKKIGKCELTQTVSDPKDIKLHIIEGVSSINDHFCAGNVFYYEGYKYMLKWLNLLFWNMYSVITKHNLEGPITIKRSSGLLDTTAIIKKNQGIRWSKSLNSYVIKVYIDNFTQDKIIKIEDIYTHNSHKELCIHIPSKDFYKDSPEWVLDVYNKWIVSIDNFRFGPNIAKTVFYDSDIE
tara:strand:- start:77 stop:673 length:597 start_codon:yes stop_codon:yes gene_type:complete